MRIGAFSCYSERLILHCITSSAFEIFLQLTCYINYLLTYLLTGPDLPILIFQADSGSIKGAGVPAEDALNIIFPGSMRDKFKHWQRRNTESRLQL